jgi:hypothetical protein
MNNSRSNLTVVIWMIRATVTIWLCNKARQSEMDYPWQNISDSDDMEILLSVTSLVTMNWFRRKTEMTTNIRTPKITIVTSTYTKPLLYKPVS